MKTSQPFATLRRAAFLLFSTAAAALFLAPVPAAGDPFTFSYTGSLHTARAGHTATLLPDGKVLVAGGGHTSVAGAEFTPIASAELFDPATGIWTQTGSMAESRAGHTATLLPNGQVLVVGGNAYDVRTAEIYNPASGLWSMTTTSHYWLYGHSATLLANGKVLFAGDGVGEVYHPSTAIWTLTGPMGSSRGGHAAVLLMNGKVLVVGGRINIGGGQVADTTTAEIYDPTSATWSSTGACFLFRLGATATLLLDGRVLLAGGTSSLALPPAELFDPSSGSGTWMLTGSYHDFGGYNTATLLPNGQVLVTGFAEETAVLYDPTSGTWISTGGLNQQRIFGQSATLLPNGNVLVAGGAAFVDELFSTATAEIYDSGATPAARTAAMVPKVQELVTVGALTSNQGAALTTKLNNVISRLASGQTIAAGNELGAFSNQVAGFVNSHSLTPPQGQALIDKAVALRSQIGG